MFIFSHFHISHNYISVVQQQNRNIKYIGHKQIMTSQQNRTRRNRQTRKRRITGKRIFTRKDYSSGDGFLTAVWGPPLWHVLHTISFNYPVSPTPQDKHNYRNFVLSLRNILPCKYCRINLRNNLKGMPLTLECMKSRDTFSKYIYNLHEKVNKMLHKNSHLSYCDVRERYEHFRSRCTQGDKEKMAQAKQNQQQQAKTLKRKLKKEMGCTVPLYGKKSRCIVNIVPADQKGTSLQIDQQCIKKRSSTDTAASKPASKAKED